MKKNQLNDSFVTLTACFPSWTFGHVICILGLMLMPAGGAFSQSECGCDHEINASDAPSGGKIKKDGDVMNVQPGDKVCIMAGTYTWPLELTNFIGTALNPIVIINCGANQVIMNNASSTQYPAIEVKASQYFKLSGKGNPMHPYGIEITQSGISISGLSSDFEIEGFEIHNSGFAGIIAKTNPSCASPDLRSFVQRNTIIHDNFIHNTHGEGMYIGDTRWPGPKTITCGPSGSQYSQTIYPHTLEGVRIYNNIVESTGWDGIQLAAATNDAAIFNNTIRNYGTGTDLAHNNGIQLSNDIVCSVYNNKLLPMTTGGRSGMGNGIVSKAIAARIFNNLIVNPGDPSAVTRKMGIQFNASSNPHPDSSHFVVNNTIINPARAGISMFHQNDGNKFYNNIIVASTEEYIIDTEDPESDIAYNYFNASISGPQFVDAAGGDYHLSPSSPCIDNGTNLFAEGVKFDLDNNSRPSSGDFDQGAYEYGSAGGGESGYILREVYTGITGNQVIHLTGHADYPDNPTTVDSLTLFETPTNYGDHYGQRIRGYVTAPTTGTYYFYISGNDYCELWLSTSDDPSGKVKVAEVAGATLVREWDKYTSQKSAAISLVEGQQYYIEALHKEGVNSDNLAVGWELPGGALERPIPASRLSPWTGGGTLSMAQNNGGAQEVLIADAESSTTLYPNPVTNTFTISLPSSGNGRYMVQLMDAKGTKLKELVSTSPGLKMEVSDLPSGMYIVNIIQHRAVIRKKLMIVRD